MFENWDQNPIVVFLKEQWDKLKRFVKPFIDLCFGNRGKSRNMNKVEGSSGVEPDPEVKKSSSSIKTQTPKQTQDYLKLESDADNKLSPAGLRLSGEAEMHEKEHLKNTRSASLGLLDSQKVEQMQSTMKLDEEASKLIEGVEKRLSENDGGDELKNSGGELQAQLQKRLERGLGGLKKEEPMKEIAQIKVEVEVDSLPPPRGRIVDDERFWEKGQLLKIANEIKDLKEFLGHANEEDSKNSDSQEDDVSKFRRLSRELILLLFGDGCLSDDEIKFQGGLIYKNEAGDIFVKRKSDDEELFNFKKKMRSLKEALEKESDENNAKTRKLEESVEYLKGLTTDEQKIDQKLIQKNSTFISSTIQVLIKLNNYLKKISAPAVGIGRLGVTSPRADNFGAAISR